MDPKVLKKESQAKETGCCFRSCGGVPCVQDFKEAKTETTVQKQLKKIK